VPVGGPILDIDVEVEDTDVEDDVSTVPAVPVGGCVGPMCAIMHNDVERKSKLSVTKYGEKGKNENATTLKTDSIKHAELPACMLMLEGHYLCRTS